MKRILSVFFAATMLILCLSGCGSKAPSPAIIDDVQTAKAAAPSDISIVTTIFPEYDWVKNILGDNPAGAQTTMLLDNGVDLHSYQPSAEDILKISTCNLFIYVGGESDEWVEDALKEAVNGNMKVINLMEILTDEIKEEEIVEGMEAEEEEEEGEEGEEEEVEYDEHVWLSLKNTKKLCGAIEKALEEIDPVNAEIYRANADAYVSGLDSLDKEYEAAVAGASLDTVLFGDRFPFRYLVDDYGLKYYAAFVGCSAETEASFETIIFLAGKVDELGLPAILTIESSDGKIAETVKNNTGAKDQEIFSMNSMQSTTGADVEAGASYLGIMEENLEVLKKALN